MKNEKSILGYFMIEFRKDGEEILTRNPTKKQIKTAKANKQNIDVVVTGQVPPTV